MKIIETVYCGYRFRSRLEARWAVYFNALGLRWEYEKEGYEFDDGTRYLPDFWLPDVKMWAEVKPEPFAPEEMRKVCLLVKETGFSCLLLDGIPLPRCYAAVSMQGEHFEIGTGNGWGNDYVISMYCNYPRREGRFYGCPGELEDNDFDPSGIFADVPPAVNAALGARFEWEERSSMHLPKH